MSTLPSNISIASSAPAGRATRSADDIRAWIVKEIARALSVDPSEVDPLAPLDSHGLDSMSAISITGKLSSWLGKNLPATLMWDCPTVDAVAHRLADVDAPASISPPAGVIPLQTRGSGSPIFFFPGVGGHPVTFMPLASHLDRPAFGLAVPGLDDRSAPLATVEEMAAAMIQNLRRAQASGPYRLAGYSFGGLLAFEAARQLTSAGETIDLLAVFDTFAPQGRLPRPLWQRLVLHGWFLLTQPKRLSYLRDRVNKLRSEEEADPSSPSLCANPAAKAKVEQIQNLNLQAAHLYRPKPYPGSMIFFTAAQRQKYNLFYRIDRQGGWQSLCKAGVNVVQLPGSHLTMLDAAHAPRAAEVLTAILKK